MLNPKRLTIAIPTYNRNAILNKTLELLVPQLNSETELLIVDNASDTPVSETLSQHWVHNNTLSIRIVRNASNIGLSGNILRCFEECNTEWMWLLSDDDIPLDGSIKNIIEDTKQEGIGDFINYYSSTLGFSRRESYSATSAGELLNKLDNFSTLLLISNGVYRVDKFIANLRWGYQCSFSVIPHVVMVLKHAEQGGKIEFLNKEITHFKEPTKDQKWSWANLSLTITSVLQLPLDINEDAFNKLVKFVYTHVIEDHEFSVNFKPVLPLDSKENYKHKYLFKLFLNSTLLRKRGFKRKLINYVYSKCYDSELIYSIVFKRKGGYFTSLQNQGYGNFDRL